ncbi:hypothetical protein K474DRAFT_1713831 [Panus rudis PR-1116 ss-1]|nr:hypothetical protein K474DRAFT_1713831 [Panus rudis PR-1116 ss-1]
MSRHSSAGWKQRLKQTIFSDCESSSDSSDDEYLSSDDDDHPAPSSSSSDEDDTDVEETGSHGSGIHDLGYGSRMGSLGENADPCGQSNFRVNTSPSSTTQPRRGRKRKASYSDANSTFNKVRRILDCIAAEKLTLAQFLDAFSWGDPECASDLSMAQKRRHFFASKEFPALLRRWRKPPACPTSHNSAPEGGGAVLDEFAVERVIHCLDEEMSSLDPYFRPRDSGSFAQKDLTDVDIPELVSAIQNHAPTFWCILDSVATTKRQRQRNKHKNPMNVILVTASLLLYSRSHKCNKLQRLFSIYLKYKGLSAKGCDTLHALYLTMSSNPSLIKRSEFGCGTAAIVHVKKDTPRLPLSTVNKLQEMRAAGMKSPLTALEICEIDEEVFPKLRDHIVFYILNVLLESEEFNNPGKCYGHKKSPELQRPKPVREIPCGPDHISHEYMLGTMHISESSYEGNGDVIEAILDQLGFKDDELRKLALEQIIFWLGDQLTADRIHNLQKLRCQDFNALERLDFALAVWGWLHAQMAHAKSLHKQYLGNESGFGFRHAFGLLNHYDLLKTSTQGAFHEKFERLMGQVLEAHIRALWCVVGGVDKVDDLLAKSPQELRSLAESIADQYASTYCMQDFPPDTEDEVKAQTHMLIRDLLRYFVVKEGIRRGDVGLMEASLPCMLFRFVGGQNAHYAVEFLETLQGLYREWPSEVRAFVTDHCWVLNLSGKRDRHTAADRIMEAGIKKAKVVNKPKGPNIDWEYLKKLHPVLPVIDHVSEHMEDMFGTWM